MRATNEFEHLELQMQLIKNVSSVELSRGGDNRQLRHLFFSDFAEAGFLNLIPTRWFQFFYHVIPVAPNLRHRHGTRVDACRGVAVRRLRGQKLGQLQNSP